MYRILSSVPDNAGVSKLRGLSPMWWRVPDHIPGASAWEKRVRKRVMEDDIRHLVDVLASSPMAGRYWLWGGVLLGWAREGRLLAHDQRDIDLAYDSVDDERMNDTIPLLNKAGFKSWFRHQNNDGVVTESTFLRHGGRFEFFRLHDIDGQWHTYTYGAIDGRPVQYDSVVPVQPRVPFTFLDRDWLKVADHEAELEHLYGNWRVPDTTWHYLDLGGVYRRAPWTGGIA
jgi:hypothetical protein